MVYCVAYGCTNGDANKKPGITFHKFPKNSIKKQQWINAVGRENWQPSATSVLCSAHFKEEQMDRTSLSVTRIREGAVPSIFLEVSCVSGFLNHCTRLTVSAMSKSWIRKGGGSYCAVALCNNSKGTGRLQGKKLSFHKFPKNVNLRKQWLVKCKRDDKFNPDTACLCSEHFHEEDYERDFQSELLGLPIKKKLKKGVVPHLKLPSDPSAPTSEAAVAHRARYGRKILKSDPDMVGMNCAIALCHNSYGKSGKLGISFHRFPKNPHLRKQWISMCKRTDRFNPDTSNVCSDHFEASDFERDLYSELMECKPKRKLKKGSVPHKNIPKSPAGKLAVGRKKFQMFSSTNKECPTSSSEEFSGASSSAAECGIPIEIEPPEEKLFIHKMTENGVSLNLEQQKEALLAEILTNGLKPTNSHQPFLDFFANEFQNIQNEFLRNRLKRAVLKELLLTTEEDDNLSQNQILI